MSNSKADIVTENPPQKKGKDFEPEKTSTPTVVDPVRPPLSSGTEQKRETDESEG